MIQKRQINVEKTYIRLYGCLYIYMCVGMYIYLCVRVCTILIDFSKWQKEEKIGKFISRTHGLLLFHVV